MNIRPSSYCGDEKMEEYLAKAGSDLSLFGLYGLLFGCLSAPELVMPSALMPHIFGEEGGDFETMDQAKETMGNIMALWNRLNEWNVEKDGSPFPAFDYQPDKAGAIRRIADALNLADAFFEGLALGGINSETMPEGLKEAAGKIEKLGELLYSEAELLENRKELSADDLAEVMKAVEDGERVIDYCILKIYQGLKETRIRAVQKLRSANAATTGQGAAKGARVGRNEPCPCGSGKKYKKCCGLLH